MGTHISGFERKAPNVDAAGRARRIRVEHLVPCLDLLGP